MQKKKSNSLHSKRDNGEESLIRLNKFIANAGVCNRRAADDFIQQGLVKVNGKAINAVGVKVSLKDKVELDGKRIYPGKKVFVLLNKPQGFDCKNNNNSNKSVLDIVMKAFETEAVSLHPLNQSEKGLIVITNDLQLQKNFNENRNKVKSLFKVELNKPMGIGDFKAIAKGVKLDKDIIKPNQIAFVDDDKKLLGIDIDLADPSLLNSVLENMGYFIKDLDRVIYSGLTKKNLARGQWRFLTDREIIQLRKNTKS